DVNERAHSRFARDESRHLNRAVSSVRRATSMDVRIWRKASDLRRVRIAPDFGAVVSSDVLEPVLRAGFGFDAITTAAQVGDLLVGYATLVPSSALVDRRWGDLPDTFELGALEVARSWRRRGIATALLASLDRCIMLEHVVVFARAFVSQWD